MYNANNRDTSRKTRIYNVQKKKLTMRFVK